MKILNALLFTALMYSNLLAGSSGKDENFQTALLNGTPALNPATPPNTPVDEPLLLPQSVYDVKEKLTSSKRIIDEFINGFNTVMAGRQNKDKQNAHILDAYMNAHVDTKLLSVMRQLHLGHDAFDQKEIIEALCFRAPDVLRYEKKSITKDKIRRYVEPCIQTASTNSQTKELFSRHHALNLLMDDPDYWNKLLLSIAENYQTGGGCWAGVRNRCAISLAYVVQNRIAQLLTTLPQN